MNSIMRPMYQHATGSPRHSGLHISFAQGIYLHPWPRRTSARLAQIPPSQTLGHEGFTHKRDRPYCAEKCEKREAKVCLQCWERGLWKGDQGVYICRKEWE